LRLVIIAIGVVQYHYPGGAQGGYCLQQAINSVAPINHYDIEKLAGFLDFAAVRATLVYCLEQYGRVRRQLGFDLFKPAVIMFHRVQATYPGRVEEAGEAAAILKNIHLAVQTLIQELDDSIVHPRQGLAVFSARFA